MMSVLHVLKVNPSIVVNLLDECSFLAEIIIPVEVLGFWI